MLFFESPQEAILWIFSFLLALTVHEASHSLAADSFGDPTPRVMGRLTLNPFAHLDLIGAIFFLVVGLGWAKPVPVNPRYFSHPRRDEFLVSFAGPASNLTLALLMAGLWRFLVSIAPAVPEAGAAQTPLVFFLGVSLISVKVNIGLALFNLIPIPPLDGSGMVSALLPARLEMEYRRIGQYGFIILFALIFFRAFDRVLFPLVNKLTGVMIGL
ncbi:site-2 protease family protein [bacterium]|nr:MAG: site-2 protease family protein [bacterium]